MNDFIEITESEDGHFTCRMPADETVVEVQLRDGSACRAKYFCNIMEAGDWDFVSLLNGHDDSDEDDSSLADQVVAWRTLIRFGGE